MTILKNGFTLKKERSRQYSTKTITNADYADVQVLLVNTRGSTLYESLKKQCSIQDGAISTLNSTKESDVNIHIS